MKLKDFIETKQIPLDIVASELKISKGYLYELLAERRDPGRKLAFRISRWSEGFVQIDDLWKEIA